MNNQPALFAESNMESTQATPLPKIVVYCDGASKGNPGPGGWGAVIEHLCSGHKEEIFGGDAHVTNNQMELMAAIKALEAIQTKRSVTVYTDSQYVCKGMSEWIVGWKKKGWVNSAKEPVKNKDLWLLLDAQCKRHDVTWRWVKGHAGHPGNERADALANMGVPGAR